MAQWEEYHTHCIRTNVGWFGVTEGQYLTSALFIATPLLPAGFWQSTACMYLCSLVCVCLFVCVCGDILLFLWLFVVLDAGFAYNELLAGGFIILPLFALMSMITTTLTKAKSIVRTIATSIIISQCYLLWLQCFACCLLLVALVGTK